jgi:tetratricopeptide (TPR) repeat protein
MHLPDRRSRAGTILIAICLVSAGLLVGSCGSRAERAQNYYEQGKNYLAKNDYPKARIELLNAVRLNDKLVDAWRALFQVDEHDHNLPSMANSLRHIVDLDKKDVDSRIKLAKLYTLGNVLDQALRIIDSAEQLSPNNADVLALKAAILLRQRNPDESKTEAEKALKIDPSNEGARMVLANEALLRGDNASALKILAGISSAHENDVGILLLKINIFERMGNTVEEEALLKKLVTLHSTAAAFRTQLVRFYLAHQRPDDAEKELRTVVAANPNDMQAELELAALLSRIKGLQAAHDELAARIKAGGNVFPLQIALAKLDFVQGNPTAGTELLQKLASGQNKAETSIAKDTLAEMDLDRNDINAADTLVEEVLKADSGNVDALRLRALIRLKRNDVDGAVTDLRRALNGQPNSPQLQVMLASAYERSGSIDLAEKAYADATKASNYAPNFGLAYMAFLERRGLASQAEDLLNELARRNPTNIAILAALARSKLAHQQWDAAKMIADTIRHLDAKNPAVDQITGAALLGQKRIDESVATLQQGYQQDPTIQPMISLVLAYLRAGQPDKAETFLDDALKKNPHDANVLALLGTVDLAKKNPQQAEIDFENAIKAQPTNPAGYGGLARLYASENKLDQATQTIQTGLQRQPDNVPLRFTLAGLLEQKHDYNGAITEYQKLLTQQPGSLIIANNLASLLSDHRTDKASLDEAHSLAVMLKDSPVPQFKDTMGWVDYQQGDYKAAIATLEEAVTKLPQVPIIHYHLGMSYLAVGDKAKATEQFNMALKLSPQDTGLKSKIDAALKQPPAKTKS